MDRDNSADNTKKIIASVVVLVAVVLATVSVNALSKKDARTATIDTGSKTTTPSTDTTTNTTTPSTPDTTSAPAADTQAYTDGTYAATGSYTSPGGTEAIKISITIQADTVTATSAQGLANDRDAEVYQQSFIEGYKSLVIGKKLDSISLSRVSGSSLTSRGFNNALNQIKDQAQS